VYQAQRSEVACEDRLNRLQINSLIVLFVLLSLAIQMKVRIFVEPEDEGGLKQDTQAPDFTLQTVDGKSVSLSQYRGKPVLVDFWATWCGPCKLEMKSLKAWHTNRIKDGKPPLTVLAVSIDRDGDDLYHYLKNHTNPFVVLNDPTGSVAKQYRVKGVPTLYFIDKDGKIRFVHVGLMPALSYALNDFADGKHELWRRP
jgi:peroxiredoxin